MLSNEDKQWIKEQLDKKQSGGGRIIYSNATSLVPAQPQVPSIPKEERKITTGDPEMDRFYELARKKKQNRESLAERLEFEKLSIKLKLLSPQRWISKKVDSSLNKLDEATGTERWKDTKQVVGTTASTLSKAASSVAGGFGEAFGEIGSGLGVGTKQLMGTLKSNAVTNDAFRLLMYSNPVTAMMMEFSPLLKGVGGAAKNILSGAVKAGGSILKGFGGAAKAIGSGAFDLASYFYGKDKNKDVETETGKKKRKGLFGGYIPTDKEEPVEEQNSYNGISYIIAREATFNGGTNNIIVSSDGLSGLFTSKQDMEQKKLPGVTGGKDYIDAEVISSKIVKTNTKLLTKGLDGIKEEVKKSNQFLDMLNKKNILILAGIGLAAAAVMGLIAWLRSSDFIKNIASAVGNIIKPLIGAAADLGDKVNDVVYAGTSSGVDQKLTSITESNYSGLKPEAINKLTNELYGGSQTKYIETQFQDKGSFWHGDKIKGMKKAGVLDSATNRLLEDAKHNWANFNASVKKFTTTGEGKKLAFPVPIKILDAEFNKDGTAAVLIERASAGEEINRNITQLHNNQVAKAVAQSPRLIITRVQKILVPTNIVIPASTAFIVVSPSYQIIGDLSAFMGKNNFASWQNDAKNEKEASDRYVRFMNQKGIDKEYFYNSKGLQEEYSKSMDKLAKKEVVKAGLMSGTHELVHKVMEKGKEWANDNTNYDPTAATVRDVDSSNVNKAKENMKTNNPQPTSNTQNTTQPTTQTSNQPTTNPPQLPSNNTANFSTVVEDLNQPRALTP